MIGHLERHELLPYFDCVRCRDDGFRVKPHPDLYLAVLEELKLEPGEAVAIEDSPNGARAAKAAGIFTIAVPNPISCTLPLDHADLRLESLSSLSLQQLLERLTPGP